MHVPTSRLCVLLSWLCAGLGATGHAATPPEPLTTAAAVLSLTGDQAAQRLPVAVTGIVTAAEPDWTGQFFVQDDTGGVFVENLGRPGPAPGDVVTIAGVSHPGAFAPIVSAPVWRKTGTAPLPAAKPVLIENLESGIEDGLRVEVAGVVRAVRIEGPRLNVDLAVGGYRLQVCAKVPAVGSPASLVAARVRVRGTAATHYNAALRHLTSVAVYVPSMEDFTVLEAETANPFEQSVIPLNSVAQYRRDGGSARRVHVRGAITQQRPGEDLFLQDSSGGIRIETAQLDHFALGEQVEAVGFLEYRDFLPLLRDAAVQPTGSPSAPVAARSVPLAELRNGLHQAALIRMRGRIVDRVTRPVARPAAGFSGLVTTWLLQGEGLTFTVEHEAGDEEPALAAIPIGSLVEVDGICLPETDGDGKLRTLRLSLPAAAGLRVLEKPSWLTPGRLLVGLGLLSASLILVVAWSFTVSKKNAALNYMVRELRKAQEELQQAHDTLEQKVVERSAQLQVEMTARKTSELQFKAVLAERTRLARDLHDTLEQTLTGIALQLDTAARLFARTPEASSHHLQLARNWLHQSQVDLRRSIWDLRSRELEQFDLADALRQSAAHLVEGTSVEIAFATHGEKRPLPEIVEENVLRIGQEALTNIAKHAHAAHISLALDYRPTALTLRVEDDGAGFTHSTLPSPGDNHFGLLGMSERAKRLAGRIDIDSAPGRGTLITVEVPLDPPDPASANLVS